MTEAQYKTLSAIKKFGGIASFAQIKREGGYGASLPVLVRAGILQEAYQSDDGLTITRKWKFANDRQI